MIAIVMVEHTQPTSQRGIEIRRDAGTALSPWQLPRSASQNYPLVRNKNALSEPGTCGRCPAHVRACRTIPGNCFNGSVKCRVSLGRCHPSGAPA
jgi:hypothetical protein